MNGDNDGNINYAVQSDLERAEKAIWNQQKEIKDISNAMTDISVTQKEMQGAFGHFSRDIDIFRQDIQRIFDRRSEDLAQAKPNYFAWVIGGVTILGSSMAFVFTFVSLVLAPMQKEEVALGEEIKALALQTQTYQDRANVRIQNGNTHMGETNAKMLEMRKDIDWLHEEVIDMGKNRHTSLDEEANQELNRRERERIENRK